MSLLGCPEQCDACQLKLKSMHVMKPDAGSSVECSQQLSVLRRNVHGDVLQGNLLGILHRVLPDDELLNQMSASIDIVQIAVVASTSAVFGLLLLAATLRKCQSNQKQRALTYSGEAVSKPSQAWLGRANLHLAGFSSYFHQVSLLSGGPCCGLMSLYVCCRLAAWLEGTLLQSADDTAANMFMACQRSSAVPVVHHILHLSPGTGRGHSCRQGLKVSITQH